MAKKGEQVLMTRQGLSLSLVVFMLILIGKFVNSYNDMIELLL